MALTYYPGQETGRGDLDIFLTDSGGAPANAAVISYAIWYVDPGPPQVEVLIGAAARTPVNPTVGEYYAALLVPPSAEAGDYVIRWTFAEFAPDPTTEVVQEFTVVAEADLVATVYTTPQQSMIDKLRLLLRDQNPDKFYHFRPPEHEGAVGRYNRVFGQIWEDVELLEYIERGLDWWNMFPPETEELNTVDRLVNSKPAWRTAILWAAISHACFALMANWTADEFDYSIGGVSLTLERSSKYESLKSNAEGQFDKATEIKSRTVKYMRGLSQPKYGIGIRSAFGPHVGRGVLGPRNFL
jgi:hypothetical protein